MDDIDERFEYYKENPWDLIRDFVFDIRSSLASIQGFSDLLLREAVGPINEKQKEFLMIVLRNSRKTGLMANCLLDLSAVIYERKIFPLQRVNLTESISLVLPGFKDKIQNKNQTFNFQISKDVAIKANAYAVEEITSKILDNAHKYTDPNGQITFGNEILDNFVKVFISDTGIEIPIEEQANVFKLFFRSNSEQVRAIPGTGTSLFLCKHYVEYFGGQIGFESEPGKGSTFWFTLPVARDEDDLDQSPSSPPD